MAETIYQGYVIKRQPYKVFDEIVTFITPQGEKISCVSMGSKRIESKNARHLFVGNYDEFQIFKSTSPDRLSKLKKAVTMRAINWDYETLVPFNLLNECINKIEKFNREAFVFYERMLRFIVEDKYSDKTQILIILRNLCPLIGLNLEVNQCVKCGSHKLSTISFKDHGMLCNVCLNGATDTKYDLIISKTIHHLFNNNYSFVEKQSIKLGHIIKMVATYIKNNSGINFLLFLKLFPNYREVISRL